MARRLTWYASSSTTTAPGTIICSFSVNGQSVAEQRGGVWTWIHSDHLHSATVITDASGVEIRRLAYAAFGEQFEHSGSGLDSKYTYTAKEADASGLMYYGARGTTTPRSRALSPPIRCMMSGRRG